MKPARMKIWSTSLFLTLIAFCLSAQQVDCSRAIISQAINGEILNQMSFNLEDGSIKYKLGSEESYSLYKGSIDFSFLVDSNNIDHVNLIVGTSMRRENDANEFYCNFGPRDDVHLLFKFLVDGIDENYTKVLRTTSFSIPTVCNSSSSNKIMQEMWDEYDRIMNKIIENKP